MFLAATSPMRWFVGWEALRRSTTSFMAAVAGVLHYWGW
jgi:hypothetical protein